MPVLATATQDNVVLLTADLDFGGYIFRDHHLAPDAGIVLYRLDDRYSPEDKAAIVGAVFAARTADDFAHHFTVIEAVHVRARPLLWFPLLPAHQRIGAWRVWRISPSSYQREVQRWSGKR